MRVTSQTSANTSTKKARLAGDVESRRVFVGLSGGVDSAVSAALLKQQGYDVAGVFIKIAIEGYPCTAGEDRLDAMRVAAHLKIPFREIDLSKEYAKKVFEHSIKEFAAGRTPNPDALCNREIKFGLFFEWCMAEGADLVATGHYAQIKNGELYMSKDKEKDQSYFLWAVPQQRLAKTLFPIGHLQKSEVRALAKKFGLPNAERKDSQGLCFLGPISIEEMLRQELTLIPGDVLDEEGDTVGRHKGAQAYTLGQRHGFELFAQTPHSEPYFVVGKDLEFNTITISTRRQPDAESTTLELTEANWIGEAAEGPCMARYRYRQPLIPADLQRFDLGGDFKGRTSVTLKEPHYAPEGQSLVLYRGEKCLGGGVILESSHGSVDRKSRRHARAV